MYRRERMSMRGRIQKGKNEQEKEDVEEKAGEEYRKERMSSRRRMQKGKNEQEKQDIEGEE